jgi:hypothetical protein
VPSGSLVQRCARRQFQITTEGIVIGDQFDSDQLLD